ncbi:hypothetical protein chiPu_0028633 [Chiloscyllium punctatum]|uniref:Uncharacterized protein n=1 Tax=Chiloscyllium punctatum TaxID=137246 RepID=A0A401TPQ7_CHIPU|nr:hypothetical protein [Chiloscyllium punctatum]
MVTYRRCWGSNSDSMAVSVPRGGHSASEGHTHTDTHTEASPAFLVFESQTVFPFTHQCHPPETYLHPADDLPEGKGRFIATNEGGGGQVEDFVQVRLVQAVKC